MTNFDWTDLFHTTQMWDLLRYRSIPYTGYDEFSLDRPVTYHPDVRFIDVQSYAVHWIWRILTGQTSSIPPRCEIYWGTDLFHTLDMTNFDCTDLLHITQISDLLRYRSIPYTGYDELWLDRPVTYHPDLWFIEVQSYSVHWILRILTGQTCYILARCDIYWGTKLFHILDMTNFEWTDLLQRTHLWDLFKYRSNPYTGNDEFWLDRPLPYHPDGRFIEVQIYSIHWIWRIFTGQACYISSRCEIYWCTELCCTLDMTNFDWTDLFHTTQMWDLLRYTSIPYTGYDEFSLDRPVTYHPDVRFIDVQRYAVHWIWRILTGQTSSLPPRCEIYWGTDLFHTLDMTNFDCTDLLHITQISDLLRYRPLVGSLQYTILANYMYWFPLPFQLPVVIWPVRCWKRRKTPNK